MLKSFTMILFSLALLISFQASSNNDEKAVFQELVHAYTAVISQYADTMIVPPSLEASGYKKTDTTITLDYRLVPKGFQITGSKGTTQLTLDNEKQVFDGKMRKISPPDPKLLREAPDVKLVSFSSAAPAQTKNNQSSKVSEKLPSDAQVKLGAELYASKACIGCHTIDGTRMAGPTLKGLYKQMRVVNDGKKVQATDKYLREAIRNPNRLVNEGYPAGMMPAYGVNAISETELDAMVAFIKSLK
jgi:mono/diheme cytochrome c family protein